MRAFKRVLITGGSGFIGSCLIRWLLHQKELIEQVVNFDKLTYASLAHNVKGLETHPRYRFIQGDVNNQAHVEEVLAHFEIDVIIHCAAQTHVDRSIADARPFFIDNVQGTLSLLEALRSFPEIHFHQVSTDEVYGSLGESGSFNEHSPYRPNSPYAASKASADHWVRAFGQTYGLSTTTSYCTNNYGPGQYPEKLIPLMIVNCILGKSFPIYGSGRQVRDWLYVEDHVEGIWRIAVEGKKGQSYGMGGNCEKSNLEILEILLSVLSQELPTCLTKLKKRIRFVTDRPGHDFRYSIDCTKIKNELNWQPRTDLEEGLRKTVQWYLKRFCKRDLLSIFNEREGGFQNNCI